MHILLLRVEGEYQSMTSIAENRIDFVIVSRRDISNIQRILLTAADNPEIWGNNHFIVVYDIPEMAAELKHWINEMLEVMPLPRITACAARPGNMGNISALREQGMEQGENPYVYFQDDDDPLPQNLDQCLAIMESGTVNVVYGIADSRNTRGQTVESLPHVQNQHFATSPEDAMRYMPTYVHPLSALFKRTVFDTVHMDDGHRYNRGGAYALTVRMLEANIPMSFIPQIIRIRKLHADNDSPILDLRAQKEFSQDILHWSQYIKNDEMREFQRQISHELNSGNLATMSDISAKVDLKIDGEYVY
jgi:hypothetical protein